MRAAAVLFALVVTPFVASVAQANPFSDPKNCGLHLSYSVQAGTRRPDAALVHGGKHGVMDRPCASDAPPVPVVQPPPADTQPTPVVEPPPAVEPPSAPACPVTEQPTAGTLSIEGRVTNQVTFEPLANWCIHLTGPVSATVLTDPYGNYKFTGLPDDTYTICEDLQSGWKQDFPVATDGVSCPTGVGWNFPLWGWPASFVNFRNSKL